MMRNDLYPRGCEAIAGVVSAKAYCGIMAGGAGTVTVKDMAGNTTQLTLAAGFPVYMGIQAITAIGTATGLVGFLP